MERLEQAKKLKGALAAVTAAVVGVIANLSLWFGLHVLFREGQKVALGPLRIDLPQITSFDWRAGLLAALAALLIFRAKWG
jgi:chromate transporter